MEEQAKQPSQPQRVINFNLPIVYANAAQVILSNADIAITFIVNGQPFQILNVSYSMAKSLSESIDKAVKQYEESTTSKIVGSKEAAPLLKKQ